MRVRKLVVKKTQRIVLYLRPLFLYLCVVVKEHPLAPTGSKVFSPEELLAQLEISGATGFLSEVVGLTGLEPVTPRLSSACSNQLSYKPGHFKLVELRRVELLTYSLQSYRSTN